MTEKSERGEERSPERKSEQLQKWEYKTYALGRTFKAGVGFVLSGLSDKNRGILEPSEWKTEEEFSLADMGEQGWELVNVVPLSDYGGAEGAGFTTNLLYIFKRPKEYTQQNMPAVSRISERPAHAEGEGETKKFSPEARETLENKGYVIYQLQGKSLADIQKETGEPYVEETELQEWVGGGKGWDHRATLGPFWNNAPDKAIEVAIIPAKLFLPESSDKGIKLQKQMLEKVSSEISQEIDGVKAVMGEAPEYVDLILQHRAKTGKTLIPEPSEHHVIATRTSYSGGEGLVEIAEFDGRLRCFEYQESLQNGGKYQTWIAPLVVPA